MTIEMKTVLARWRALEYGDGLRRAKTVSRILWVIGYALFVFVVFGVVSKLHPAVIAVAAATMGWIIAEVNALRTRMAQWPIFRRYIDWKHVQEDLNNDANSA